MEEGSREFGGRFSVNAAWVNQAMAHLYYKYRPSNEVPVGNVRIVFLHNAAPTLTWSVKCQTTHALQPEHRSLDNVTHDPGTTPDPIQRCGVDSMIGHILVPLML